MCAYNVADPGGEGHVYVRSRGHTVMVRQGSRDTVYRPPPAPVHGTGVLGTDANRRLHLVLHHVLALRLLFCPVARGCLSPHPTPAAPLVTSFMDQVMYLGMHESGEN